VSFATVDSQQMFIIVVDFIIDSVWKLLVTPLYMSWSIFKLILMFSYKSFL